MGTSTIETCPYCRMEDIFYLHDFDEDDEYINSYIVECNFCEKKFKITI